MKIVSRKQAAFLGRIASGKKVRGGKGPSRAKARLMLDENSGRKFSDLPVRAPSRKPQRSNYRRSSR